MKNALVSLYNCNALQRYSLQESGVEAVVLEAFDINEVANDVYEHNFGHRPSQVSVFSTGVVYFGTMNFTTSVR